MAHSMGVFTRHARSFSLAARLLPAGCEGEAAVVYTFCRLVDDLADEAESADQARADLAQVARELDGAAPARPVVAGFLDIAARRGMDIGVARELMAGCLSDLGQVEVQDDAELLRYCYRVAGTVGLMMCAVLGVRDPRAVPHAVDLGLAMQITNICRDVREDAERGRVYLPATRLAAEGLVPADLLDPARMADPDRRAALGRVVVDLLRVAEGCYRRAWHGMHHIPARPRLGIVVAARLYRDIGLRLWHRHGGDAWHGRTMVPPVLRLVGVAAGLLQAAHPVSWGRGVDDSPACTQPLLHRALAGMGGLDHIHPVLLTARAG